MNLTKSWRTRKQRFLICCRERFHRFGEMSAHDYKKIIFIAVFCLLVLVLIAVLGVIISTYSEIGSPCIRPECFERFYTLFRIPLAIIVEGLPLIAFLSAGIAALVALQNYEVSVKSSSLSSYITHLNLFRDFVESEATRLGINHEKSIDIFTWLYVS